VPRKWHARFWRPAGGVIPSLSSTEAYDLASYGVRPLTAPTVTLAIVGWSAPYRCAKPVANWANRPLASWSTPSLASSKVVNPTSPGFIENLSTLLHAPCRRVPLRKSVWMTLLGLTHRAYLWLVLQIPSVEQGLRVPYGDQ
jgi:hypothetical protein